MQSGNLQPDRQDRSSASWPVIDGSYYLGDPSAPIAVCVLTSEELAKPLAQVPGVAIAGQVQTANLGIERIILNVTTNPSIRFLFLCGKESRLFRPGQTLGALLDNGMDAEGRVAGAQGYEPVLRNLPREQVDVFRRQVELVDWIDEQDLATLQERIKGVALRNPGRFEAAWGDADAAAGVSGQRDRFRPVRPGGQREPLVYDPKGYFVITLDRAAGEIVLRHYLPDHTPAHEMRGRSAEPMLLGLLREGLVSQLSHAGYLGVELAKAEAALRLGSGVRYMQDRALRQEVEPAPPSSAPAAPTMPPISPPLTWKQLTATPMGEEVNVVFEVDAQTAEYLLEGTFAEASEREPFSLFYRTEHLLRVHWSKETQVVMGTPAQVTPGALLRARGKRRSENEVDADRLVILTGVARLLDQQAPPSTVEA